MKAYIRTVEQRSELMSKLLLSLPNWIEPIVLRQSNYPDCRSINRALLVAVSRNHDKWSMILEDDAQVSVNLTEHVCDVGADVVQLFSRKSHAPGITRDDPSSFIYSVGLFVRGSALSGISESCAEFYKRFPEHKSAMDLLLRFHFVKWKALIYTTYPSLVQHLPVKSTLGPRSTKRQSPTFEG
jgi:hypothetical protein